MPAEQSIRLLSDAVANKIAAGEVVERPASVLKELIENALDAGATQIDVNVAAGGRTLVAVADNGSGMSRDDALLSVERHATSKIRDVDDLERIATLGFRGEALAAISAVARFRMLTRRAADIAGTELTISAGMLQDVREAGCPPGTCIEVRNLFFNVPARRKFLRSEQTELARLRQVFNVYALAHKDLGIKLTVDNRLVAQVAAVSALPERLRDLFAWLTPENLRPVMCCADGLQLDGYVGVPALARTDRAEQYVFINGRPASAPVLAGALREGYHSLLARDRHPVVFLFLTLDPALVDVNVHPAKREVRFRNPGVARHVFIEGIRRALSGNAGGVVPSGGAVAATILNRGVLKHDWRQRNLAGIEPDAAARVVYPRVKADLPPVPANVGTFPADAKAGIPGAQPAVAAASTSPWAWFRVLGQVGGLYVVMETEDGLTLMDPHAAHERVLYERLMAQIEKGAVESQRLLIPETVELSPRDALCARRHLDLLKKTGFGIAEFGENAFLIDALPACLAETTPRVLITDIVAMLDESGGRRGAGMLREESVAQAACKAAVKAHQTLKPLEIEELIAQLAQAEMPYTCPHGRPTLIHTSFRELAKRFGRA